MHRLVIAVAAVFLIATSTATGQNTKIVYFYTADTILAEGKVLHVRYTPLKSRSRILLQGYVFIVAFKGKIFSCYFEEVGDPVECTSSYGGKAYLAVKDKKK